MSVDIRTLVMGDWSPLIRDPLDLLRLLFAAGATPSATSSPTPAARSPAGR